MYQTNYAKNFGHWEFDFADPTILKFKSLTETSAAEILNSRMKSYLDKWMSLGDTQEYVKSIIETLKGIFTWIRHDKKYRSEYKAIYQKYDSSQQYK